MKIDLGLDVEEIVPSPDSVLSPIANPSASDLAAAPAASFIADIDDCGN